MSINPGTNFWQDLTSVFVYLNAMLPAVWNAQSWFADEP